VGWWFCRLRKINRYISAIFYRHVLEEPLLKSLFENMPPEHSHRVTMWIAEIFGGPKLYSGRFDKDTAHPSTHDVKTFGTQYYRAAAVSLGRNNA
jgi:truncated hemoglobin YjbI